MRTDIVDIPFTVVLTMEVDIAICLMYYMSLIIKQVVIVERSQFRLEVVQISHA